MPKIWPAMILVVTWHTWHAASSVLKQLLESLYISKWFFFSWNNEVHGDISRLFIHGIVATDPRHFAKSANYVPSFRPQKLSWYKTSFVSSFVDKFCSLTTVPNELEVLPTGLSLFLTTFWYASIDITVYAEINPTKLCRHTLSPGQNGRHAAENIFKFISLYEYHYI